MTLSIKEMIFLDRNRQDLDRKAYAALHKITVMTLREWESGEIPNDFLTYLENNVIPSKDEMIVIEQWRHIATKKPGSVISDMVYRAFVPYSKLTVNPTVQELMFLERRRMKLTQKEYGKHYGVTQVKVSRWENGTYPIPAEIARSLHTLELTENELLTIIRRRKGERIEDVANKIGVSRQYLTDVERKGRGNRAKEHLRKYLKKS